MKVYPKAKEALLNGDLALDSANIVAYLVTSGYTQDDAHNFLDDVLAANRLGVSGNLASKTTTDGTFDAADPAITIDTDGTGVAVIFVEATGVEATSHLIAYIDKAADGTTALSRPVLNGDTVNVGINASGIFSL